MLTYEQGVAPFRDTTRLTVISLYARGLSVREIQAHLKELYGTEVPARALR